MENHSRDRNDISENIVSPVTAAESCSEHDTHDGRLSPCESDVSSITVSRRPQWTLSVFTALPEVVNFSEHVGKEIVVHYPDEKAAFQGYDKVVVEPPSYPEVAIDTETGKEVVEEDEANAKRRSIILTPSVWSRKARLLVSGFAILMLLAISLGIGLPVALTSKKTQPPQAGEVLIGGAIEAKYYSTEGAFNGTGLALTYQNFTSSPGNITQGSLILYFQHWTGDIRYMQLAPNGTWAGGGKSEFITNNATNSTSLSAVSYVVNNSSEWHIFYIDKKHRIREAINSNNTDTWDDGPICNLYTNTLVSDQIGLQACWVDVNDPATVGPDVGLNLWYAPNETSFAQLSWRGGTEVYSYQDSWQDVNGHSSPGCYSWGPGMTTYFMFVDLHGRINFYWRDTSSNMMSTPQHPINKWTNTSITIPGVGGTANLAYMDVLAAQSEDDHMFREYSISWAAENTTLAQGSGATIGDEPGLPGSRVATTTIPNTEGGKDILVFFQTMGSDITQYRRNVEGGEWSKTVLPIPLV